VLASQAGVGNVLFEGSICRRSRLLCGEWCHLCVCSSAPVEDPHTISENHANLDPSVITLPGRGKRSKRTLPGRRQILRLAHSANRPTSMRALRS
jgi:hypothetical protein